MTRVEHANAVERTLRVEVWFDLICPWCWIGKHLLDQALERLAQSDADVQVDTIWHSVQLIPQTPAEGWPYEAFYEHRLGGREAMLARRAQVQVAAQHAGAPIDYARMAIFPNTAAAHRLASDAMVQLTPDRFEAFLTRLFEGYFVRGENLGDEATLMALAAEFGVRHIWQTGTQFEPLAAMPVSGVPYFLIDGVEALSGAQPAETLWAAMRRALSRRSLLNSPA